MKNLSLKKILKIGELAKEAGVTVRTLHYYDQIGLLQPSADRDTGHRYYTRNDVERLQQVISLKSMGFSLEEISKILKKETYDLSQVLTMQKASILAKIESLQKVHELLELMLIRMDKYQNLTIEELLSLIKGVNEMEKLYTTEQVQKLKERFAKTDPKKIKAVEDAWPVLFKKFEEAINQGLDPSHPMVQKLAAEAQNYIDQFTGGDKDIEANLDRGYVEQQESAFTHWGVSKKIFDYARQARKIFQEKGKG